MDNKNKQDNRDRSQVAGSEDYEVSYVAQKFNVKPDEVRDAIGKVGNKREDLENYFSGRQTG